MFTVDSRTENFLTQLGVKFEYQNGILLPQDFAEGWDQDNLGRPVAIREDAVLEYAALMDGGSAAPAPIYGPSSTGLRVLDGLQRLSAAHLRGETRVSGYVIDTQSEDLIATIRVLANARLQGRAESPEWTRRRAVEVLVIGRQMSPAEVAAMGGWKRADVERIAEAIELQQRISQAGGPKLPDTMLHSVAEHLPPGGLLEKAAEPVAGFLWTLKQSKLSADDASPYIDAFFAPLPSKANPYRCYGERLEDIRTDPEIESRVTGRRSVEIPRDVVLLRLLKAANTAIDNVVAHSDRLVNIDEYFRLVDRVRKKLHSIAGYKQATSAPTPADMWSTK